MNTERFTDHALEVRHDHDLYRHLYCAQPDTITHSFEIITAPGNLLINGDIKQSFAFGGERDVFALFRGSIYNGNLNYAYLTQKITSDRNRQTIREYRRSLMVENIQRDALAAIDSDYHDDLDGLLDDIENNLLPELVGHEEHDRSVVRNFSYFHFEFDISEWDVYALTEGFKYACDAISWAIGQYDQQLANGD